MSLFRGSPTCFLFPSSVTSKKKKKKNRREEREIGLWTQMIFKTNDNA